MTENVRSQLIVILDTNPVWWGQKPSSHTKAQQKMTLTECLDSVMVFAHSHLMMNHSNKLAVIAAHSDQSVFLYPKNVPPTPDLPDSDGVAEVNDGKYELFNQVDKQIEEGVKSLIENCMNGQLYPESLIAGALTMALCYINKTEKSHEESGILSSRILVIKGSEDNTEQYMNLMNAVFTAQKQNVVIDACVLDNDSGLLQQACDITGGIYLKIPQMKGLLQYLLWVFLPDPLERPKLTLPPKVQVDYRAACFCHRNLIDVGYVCSVCLSIFCAFSPICGTCQTTFKIFGPSKGVKKKSKKPG
ncbi:general transcription factor IIH subunit 3-like [Ostrea edulis]|uniref:general transcription factor IIH subunit 3-like n=1 Tax=Ostrea edulis TaxID=37623 RepID=UPI0024AF56E1|nr:general transcription factor IIH subunit 3-like [Ostrea edulis]